MLLRWGRITTGPIHMAEALVMSEVRDPGDHVGQLSADGKLMWDGQAWQPVGSSGPRPEPAAARTTSADARKSARTVLVAGACLGIVRGSGLLLGRASRPSSEPH